MRLKSNGFGDGALIPGEFAFAVIDPLSHVALGNNRNPHLAWDDVPARTQSFVLMCHDPDAPSRGDDVNKVGCEVPKSLPHHYIFTLYALDVPRLEAYGGLIGTGIRVALAGHMLAETRLTGLYMLNPRLMQQQRSRCSVT
ncbi:YbhB/YbcL family Raf kinase inhibitor-like protein [Acidisphaera sp. S103]|uniref:YbhB/YbcL family Raf kinase inhibitor-like protein n=1 Tax=Acidisphaera sp. S103 TaxID=1747223 RepID=UPI00131CDD69|nr:YbhB/YbcL family Raf kinase inhibitor-like protein [Acidisphaera sp. S103]